MQFNSQEDNRYDVQNITTDLPEITENRGRHRIDRPNSGEIMILLSLMKSHITFRNGGNFLVGIGKRKIDFNKRLILIENIDDIFKQANKELSIIGASFPLRREL